MEIIQAIWGLVYLNHARLMYMLLISKTLDNQVEMSEDIFLLLSRHANRQIASLIL